MIKLLAFNKRQFSTKEYSVRPTIFPDGTSQVWQLPDEMLNQKEYKIVWNFAEEREIFDITNLAMLLMRNPDAYIHLHIPYLPYARQDKDVNNSSTFSLHTFAHIINSCNFDLVTAVDVHNPFKTSQLIKNFENITVDHIQQGIMDRWCADCLVYPDHGATGRYKHYNFPFTYFDKVRNQTTGEIEGLQCHELNSVKNSKMFLILDDICDGGRTFIEVAKVLKELVPDCKIVLFVTHGIFSKGKEVLYNAGISDVFTTNSLMNNPMGYEV